MAAQATKDLLTPSEAVLLYGDRFLKKAMLGEKPLLGEHKVSITDHAEKIMTAAIIANQQRGFVTLNIEKGKALFGLVKTQKLRIAPGSGVPDWPEESTESALVRALGQNTVDLDDLVISFIGDISSSPGMDYIARVKGGLAARGIVTAEKKKVLGIFSSTNISLTPEQRARIEQQGFQPAQALLTDAGNGDKEIFDKVESAVSEAFANRTRSE